MNRLRSVLRGTGPLTWAVYFVALGGLLYLLAPGVSGGLIGALAGGFAAVRVELNGYRARVERLEALAADPGLEAERRAPVGGRVPLGGV